MNSLRDVSTEKSYYPTMENKDFYMTLPSNSSLQHFPANTLSSFKVLLPRRINLSSEYDWEMGLSEIQYPLSIGSLNQNDHVMIGLSKNNRNDTDYDDDEQIPRTESSDPFQNSHFQIIHEKPTVTITSYIDKKVEFFHYLLSPPTNMSMPHEIVTYLNTFLNSRKILNKHLLRKNMSPQKAFNIIYENGGKNRSSILEITLNSVFEGLSLMIPPSIARILGFPLNDQQFMYLPYPGRYVYVNQKLDISANRPPIFFVYNNLVAPSLIGNYLAPNLRSVVLPRNNENDEKTKYVSTSFSPINYYPLAVKSFNIIETELRSQTGEKIPFDYGVVNVILHCRPKLSRHRFAI